ncbi:MAG: hypothetical protein JNG84_02665 [Archangium sp.]|nr:hypothetical protein [Archangium sp.]
MNRHALWAAAALVALAGCGATSPGVDAGIDAGPKGCVTSDDCPDSRLFSCNVETQQCEPACRTKDDCGAMARGSYALDFCGGSLGCQCDEGRCVGALCSADSDCGTQVCRNGACVPPPAATEATKCQVIPDFVVLKPGAKRTFFVSTWKGTEPIIIKAGGTWSAPSGSNLTGSGTGASAEFTAATAGASAVTAVSVTVGGATCTAKALVVSGPSSGVGVVVTDEMTGRPVPMVDVVLSQPDGTVIQQNGSASVKTDARGMVQLSGQPSGSYSVSAFHADYNYTTIANYSGTSADKDFLSINLRRNAPDKFGGYKGTFTGVPMSSKVHAGIAGLSLLGGITTLSTTQLLGPNTLTDIKIANIIDRQDVPLPAGVFLALTEQSIKAQISGQGLPNVCTDSSGAPDETKIAAGTCGTQTAWALSGDVSLGELPIDKLLMNVNNIDYGSIVATFVPLLRTFHSSLVRDVGFTLKPVAYDSNSQTYDYSDLSQFTEQNLNYLPGAGSNAIPLSFTFAARMPTLPQFDGEFADATVVVAGANFPGRGVVPLGLGAAVNTTPKDSKLDKLGDLPEGLIQLRMAPTHHGLEGSDYVAVFFSASAAALTNKAAGLAASALFPRIPNNKLAFDPKGTTPMDFSSLTFPPAPPKGNYNFIDATQGSLAGRTFAFSSPPSTTGVQVMRVTFTDGAEHIWQVFVDPAKAAQGFTLPKPPGALADRTFSRNVSSGARSTMLVESLRLKTDPAAATSADVTFNGLVEFNSTNVDRLTSMLTAFAFFNGQKPRISFNVPDEDPKTLARGSKVSVNVTNFKLGASGEGQVRISFTLAGLPVAVCPTAVSATETMPGSGLVEFTLPMSCVGAGMTLAAELVGTGANPTAILPPVAVDTTVTVQ